MVITSYSYCVSRGTPKPKLNIWCSLPLKCKPLYCVSKNYFTVHIGTRYIRKDKTFFYIYDIGVTASTKGTLHLTYFEMFLISPDFNDSFVRRV